MTDDGTVSKKLGKSTTGSSIRPDSSSSVYFPLLINPIRPWRLFFYPEFRDD
jgi:hypothetical protein